MNKSITRDEIVAIVQELIAEETKLPIEKINPEQHLSTFGLDSINSIYVLDRLEDKFNIKLNPLLFYDYPTVASFSNHIDTLINP